MLTPPDMITPAAKHFDAIQRLFFPTSNTVRLTLETPEQILLPIRLGGQGFTPLSTLNIAVYAASLASAARICFNLSIDDGLRTQIEKDIYQEVDHYS